VQSAWPENVQGDISGVSRSVCNLGSSLGVAIAGSLVAGAIPGGGQYFSALVIVEGFAMSAGSRLCSSRGTPRGTQLSSFRFTCRSHTGNYPIKGARNGHRALRSKQWRAITTTATGPQSGPAAPEPLPGTKSASTAIALIPSLVPSLVPSLAHVPGPCVRGDLRGAAN